jgi:hypothetical protein
MLFQWRHNFGNLYLRNGCFKNLGLVLGETIIKSSEIVTKWAKHARNIESIRETAWIVKKVFCAHKTNCLSGAQIMVECINKVYQCKQKRCNQSVSVTIQWQCASSCEANLIAQAFSRRFPIPVARVRSQVRSCWICAGQSGTGESFLRVLRFPLPILIPPDAPYSSIIWGWYNRPGSGLHTKWTVSPHPKEVIRNEWLRCLGNGISWSPFSEICCH